MSNKKYLDEQGLIQVLQAVSSRLNTKVISVTSADPSHIIVDNTDPLRPVIGLDSDLLNKINTMWNAMYPHTKETTPIPLIDFTNQILTSLVSNAVYSVNGTLVSADSTGNIAINSNWFGSTISIVKKSTGPTMDDSNAANLVIPQIPSAPVLTSSNGVLSGVTNSMEYRLSPNGAWSNVTTGNTISDLPTGTYDVRVKATTISFAGIIASIAVTVPVPTGWTMTYNFPKNPSVITGTAANIPLSTWTGYDSSKILDENELYSVDLQSMADIKTHLYAKFVTDTDFKEVYFDNFGNGTSQSNSLQRWGFTASPVPTIYIVGSNSTSNPIQLKLVKEG